MVLSLRCCRPGNGFLFLESVHRNEGWIFFYKNGRSVPFLLPAAAK
jgi:hypothetical protein